MNKRRVIFFASFLLLLAAGKSFAKSLSIQIIQKNAGKDSVWATSYLFEQNIIDYFFSTGNIVSSSPIWINDSESEEKNRGALKAALIENREGGMDYLARIEINYSVNESSNPDAFLLENVKDVSWKIYSLRTDLEVFNGSVKPEKVTSKNNNESGLSDLAGLVAYKISNGLKNQK